MVIPRDKIATSRTSEPAQFGRGTSGSTGLRFLEASLGYRTPTEDEAIVHQETAAHAVHQRKRTDVVERLLDDAPSMTGVWQAATVVTSRPCTVSTTRP